MAGLPGLTLEGVIMVIRFLKDNRVEQERRRADAAEARAVQERQRADLERDRTFQLLDELLEARKKNRDAMEARLHRLEERLDGDGEQ